jgi:hypothetical protein
MGSAILEFVEDDDDPRSDEEAGVPSKRSSTHRDGA